MTALATCVSGRFAAGVLFPLHPPTASTIARGVDNLYFALTGITLFFTFLIFGLIFYFMIKYRRRSENEIPQEVKTSMPLEIAWTLIPTLICAMLFVWSARLFVKNSEPPKGSMEVFVIGKQWMWQLQHPEGAREIDELHVPVGVPVKLTMTSQDVIHDFYIPAFRIKKDVVPGRYSSIWFEATKTGEYPFACAQYCGAEHSAMRGKVFVMKERDYAKWITGQSNGNSMAQAGQKLFASFGCATCHAESSGGKYPTLAGVYGHSVKLRDGRMVIADDAYLRDAISKPGSEPVAGYASSMPSFQGQINEVQLLDLIAYIKSIGPPIGQAAIQ
ncbi:MAG TPA: cytochrome c oxidase subunit II [Candidatus Acidoferrales bacterium]|nr:cytochrome c oxidase subunit II [Candidatus Acidoferrales bacterium]